MGQDGRSRPRDEGLAYRCVSSAPIPAVNGSTDFRGPWVKGILFNLLEAVVTAEFGEDAWDDTLDAAGVIGAYTAIGSYEDAEFLTLLGAMPTRGPSSAADQLRWFGRRAMPVLADRYAVFFAPHASTRAFLLTLNDIVHPEVRKLYPGADVPVFDFPRMGADGSDTVSMSYESARRLCWLAEGFVLGAGDHYGETVVIEQDECMHDGAARCLIRCTFSEADGGRVSA